MAISNCTAWRSTFDGLNIPTAWFSPQDSFNLTVGNDGWHCHACQDPWPLFQQEAQPGVNPFPLPKVGLGYIQLNLLLGFNGNLERGFISQKLQSPLSAGETYTIEFYVRTFKWSMKLCSNLGVLFTADSLDYFAFKQNLIPDFEMGYLWVPNAFTPDGDGINEYFAFQGAPQPVTLHIFDRWGKRVFFIDNYQNNWDGTYQGEPLPAGVYTYLIEYLYINPNGQQQNPDGSKRQVRGTVTIIR